MLYDTIKNEGAMQKAAGVDYTPLAGAMGAGGGIGALTNDGNRAAGALGGAVGLPAVYHAITKLPFMQALWDKNRNAAAWMLALGSAGGGYLGGKLGAKIDSATGNHLTQWTNKLLGRE